MNSKNDFNLIKLPSNGRMLTLTFVMLFIIGLFAPVQGLTVIRNELGAFAGTSCLLLLVNWWLKKNGLGLSQLLKETTEPEFKSRMRRVLKLFGLYLLFVILGYYLIYGAYSITDSLTGGKLLKLSSFQLYFARWELQNHQRLLNSLAPAPLWGFFAIVVLEPFLEELLFRRFLYVALRKRYGFMFSLFITSVFFGLMHASALLLVISTTILGGFLGYLYEKQKDFCANVVFHGLNNLFALFIFWVTKL